jgi:copper(I)-binding protein
MTRFQALAIAVVALAALAAPAAHADDIAIADAWARATPGKAPTGAAYLTLTNSGAAADRLVGASSPVAATTELHEDKEENGIMKMRPVPVLPIAPGQSITLKPGGYHLMLTGLKAPLKQGESFPLTLTFEKAGAKEVQVAIGRAGAMSSAGTGGMGNMGGMSGMAHDMGDMKK